ncbi:hypothetical protein BC828DRAFT_377600 [Blastocladiella britannica]|nr:hypothetical protein BC828DRAFT_377600 [Blastocladiella britannica]
MLTLEPTPPRGKYRFEAALVHPQLTSRPDFADWMLMHLEDFLTANVRPALLLYAMATEVAGFLKTLHRVFPVSMPPWSHASLEYTCLTRCKDLMYELFVSISKAREPVLMFRAILAALLIGRVDWRPDHPLVSRTAVVVDFGPELSPTAGIAALRALLVQSAGGDAAVADALIVGFEAMPPVVVRNAMVSFAPATTSNFPRRSLDLFSAVLSIDPPPLSTMLDHEAVRLAVSSSPSGDSQESTLLVPHNKVPLWVPRFGTESSLNPVISAIVRCEGCRLRLGQHFEGMDEAAACEWGVVVDVPTLLSFQ